MGQITSKDYEDFSFKLPVRVSGTISVRKENYYAGLLNTKHGMARIVSHKKNNHSFITFVHKGVRYHRVWKRSFSEKYLKTLAFEFADEIVNQN